MNILNKKQNFSLNSLNKGELSKKSTSLNCVSQNRYAENKFSEAGFTLLELFTALGIISALAAISINLYDDYQYKAFEAKVKASIHDLTLATQAQFINTETASTGGDIGANGYYNFTPNQLDIICLNFSNWATYAIDNPVGCKGIVEGYTPPGDVSVFLEMGYSNDLARRRTSWYGSYFTFVSKNANYMIAGWDRSRSLGGGILEYYVEIYSYNMKKGTARKVGEIGTAKI